MAHQPSERRDPNDLDAWILGSGIGSLTAAIHLIQEANVPPSRIHFLEALEFAGGGTATCGDPVNGYHYRAGVMPILIDAWTERLFSLVPSKTDPNKTLLDMMEINRSKPPTKKLHTRFLARKSWGVERINTKDIRLGLRDHMDLLRLGFKSERSLGRARISDYFHKSFFQSDYWLLLASTYVSFDRWTALLVTILMVSIAIIGSVFSRGTALWNSVDIHSTSRTAPTDWIVRANLMSADTTPTTPLSPH
jgi:oleate hydratase